jgi:hypothetical protein
MFPSLCRFVFCCRLSVGRQVALWRARAWKITSTPPRPIIASASPPAAPMPASPQANPLGAVTRTIVGGLGVVGWLVAIPLVGGAGTELFAFRPKRLDEDCAAFEAARQCML